MKEHPMITAARERSLFQLEAVIDVLLADAMHAVRLGQASLRSPRYEELLSLHFAARAMIAERSAEAALRNPEAKHIPGRELTVTLSPLPDFGKVTTLRAPALPPGATPLATPEKKVLHMPGRRRNWDCACGGINTPDEAICGDCLQPRQHAASL